MYTYLNLYRQKNRSHDNVTICSLHWYAFTENFNNFILEKNLCIKNI